jgi:hypothetical protein
MSQLTAPGLGQQLQPQPKGATMHDEVRINAAIAELNAIIQSLIQRNINLAGDLAVAQQQLKEMQNEKTDSAS